MNGRHAVPPREIFQHVKSIAQSTPIETRHPLSGIEGLLEEELVASIHRQLAGFAGAPADVYDGLIEMTPLAEGVTCSPVDEDGVRGWWVRPREVPSDQVILFLHGGAYMLGSAAAYRGFASQIAGRAGVAAFVLDYPLAPLHPFPAAYDATIAALVWLKQKDIARVALVGDSAGGGLALAASNATGISAPRIASVVAFSPWTDLAFAGASFHDSQTRDPIFDPIVLVQAASAYLAGADRRDGRASPLYGIADALPPIAIQVGENELLLDDARRYAMQAAQKGGIVYLDLFEGLHHVFQRSTNELPSARIALDRAAAFIATHWMRP